MPIIIKNIKFNDIRIDHDLKVTGSYCLMGDKGKVVAKQGFNGYNDVKIELSKDSINALDEFVSSLQDDIEISTGINEAVKELKEK